MWSSFSHDSGEEKRSPRRITNRDRTGFIPSSVSHNLPACLLAPYLLLFHHQQHPISFGHCDFETRAHIMGSCGWFMYESCLFPFFSMFSKRFYWLQPWLLSCLDCTTNWGINRHLSLSFGGSWLVHWRFIGDLHIIVKNNCRYRHKIVCMLFASLMIYRDTSSYCWKWNNILFGIQDTGHLLLFRAFFELCLGFDGTIQVRHNHSFGLSMRRLTIQDVHAWIRRFFGISGHQISRLFTSDDTCVDCTLAQSSAQYHCELELQTPVTRINLLSKL